EFFPQIDGQEHTGTDVLCRKTKQGMLVARQFPFDFLDQRIHASLKWAGIIAPAPVLPAALPEPRRLNQDTEPRLPPREALTFRLRAVPAPEVRLAACICLETPSTPHRHKAQNRFSPSCCAFSGAAVPRRS